MAIFLCRKRPWPTFRVGSRLVSFARGGMVDTVETARRLQLPVEQIDEVIRATPAFEKDLIVEVDPEADDGAEGEGEGDPDAGAGDDKGDGDPEGDEGSDPEDEGEADPPAPAVDLSCPECEREFGNLGALRSHMARKHPAEAPQGA